jgi:putative MATE family efflux protein
VPSLEPAVDARPLNRAVLHLALPAITSGLVAVAYHWVNQGWVDRLGEDDPVPPAALAVGIFFAWGFNSLFQLVVSGLTALVSRYAGAGRPDAAAYVGLQGIRWSWVVALVGGVLGFVLVEPILERAGLSARAQAEAAAYVRIVYGGAIGWGTLASCEAVFRARGDARTPMLVHASALVLNAALDPFLIFGIGPFPRLGVAGAALATVICWALAAATSFALLARRGWVRAERPSDERMRLREDTPLRPGPLRGLDLSVARRVVRVGMPAAVQGLFFVAVYFELSRIVVRAGGDAAQAGLGLGLRGESVAFVLCNGFAAAASVLVGRNLGAGRPDEAARSAWRSALLAGAACAAWGLVLGLLDGAIVDVLHAPEAVVPHARAYYRIVALALVPQALEIVLDGAFAGAGMTLPPMVVSLTFAAARVPLASWAAFDLGGGVPAIWWTISATAAARGVVIALWFSRNRWKTQAV